MATILPIFSKQVQTTNLMLAEVLVDESNLVLVGDSLVYRYFHPSLLIILSAESK